MSLDSLIYLVEFYWPFLLVAFAIGLGTGWLSLSPGSPVSKPGRAGK